MKRRDLVLVGAGVAAAAAGVAWRLRAGDDPAPASAATAAPDEAALAFWQSSFTLADGQVLAMNTLRGKPLLLNFWATWCAPCVKEMPEIDRFARGFVARGGAVVGLAVDNPTAVRTFLARTPVSYTIGLAGFDGTDLSRKLGNTSGSLPFTAVFGRGGAVVRRKLGQTSFEELQRWAAEL